MLEDYLSFLGAFCFHDRGGDVGSKYLWNVRLHGANLSKTVGDLHTHRNENPKSYIINTPIIITYILNRSIFRVLSFVRQTVWVTERHMTFLENLRVAQLHKKFPVPFETHWFIALITIATTKITSCPVTVQSKGCFWSWVFRTKCSCIYIFLIPSISCTFYAPRTIHPHTSK